MIDPQRPDDLDPLAIAMLEDLQRYPEEAQHVILGGGFALKHFHSFRPTHDIDAWWHQRTSEAERAGAIERLRSIARNVATEHGLSYKERPRASNDVVSLELSRGSTKTFAFQIAPRTIELDPPLVDRSPWAPIPMETLRDNIGSKMTALVGRGAPRDFQDVYALTRAGLVTIEEAWGIWEAKNPGLDVDAAKAQVLKRIESIELRRPIESVPTELRDTVAESRRWVREELARPSFGIAEIQLEASEPELDEPEHEGLEP
jgi:hypothetical protein